MFTVKITTNVVQITLSGEAGYHYQILRSSKLSDWSVLATITMGPTGIYTYVDSAPPTAVTFYRAASVP